MDLNILNTNEMPSALQKMKKAKEFVRKRELRREMERDPNNYSEFDSNQEFGSSHQKRLTGDDYLKSIQPANQSKLNPQKSAVQNTNEQTQNQKDEKIEEKTQNKEFTNKNMIEEEKLENKPPSSKLELLKSKLKNTTGSAKEILLKKLKEKKKWTYGKRVEKEKKIESDIPNSLINKNNILEDKKAFAVKSFVQFDLDKGLLKSLDKMGFKYATKVQNEVFNTIFTRRDCIVRSVTGSGKTLAYLLPIYQDLLTLPTKITRKDGIHVIIVSPTRELALQIHEECNKLSFGCIRLVSGRLVGGETSNHEKARIRKGLNIVVGTPSRIAYHLKNTNNFYTENLRTIVFEESDLTLSLGQGKDIKEILAVLKEREYSIKNKILKIFTTASYDRRVKELIENGINDNFELVGDFNFEDAKKNIADDEVLVPEQLEQNYCTVEEKSKFSFLLALAHRMKERKMIFFVSTADQANFVTNLLQDARHLAPRKKDGDMLEKRPPPKKFKKNFKGKDFKSNDQEIPEEDKMDPIIENPVKNYFN